MPFWIIKLKYIFEIEMDLGDDDYDEYFKGTAVASM